MASETRTTADVPPGLNGDCRKVADFLAWARKSGFAVSRLVVDGVEVNCTDLRIEVGGEPTRDNVAKPPPSTTHDALADQFGMDRPSDAEGDDDDDGEGA